MNTTTAERHFMMQGMPVWLRFMAYIGAILGASALTLWGNTDAYTDSGLLFYFTGSSALWIASGAILGGITAIASGMAAPHLSKARMAANFTPWLDGLLLMIVIAAICVLFEPTAQQFSYEDQSALFSGKMIFAMNVFFLASALLYITHLFAPAGVVGNLGTWTARAGLFLGGAALLLRWYESYMLDLEIGHAPVSNLYEVFILLFCITTAIYLSLEKRYQARSMGAFVMPLVAAGVFFGIWLGSIGQADIKPLVPALQSYWMKIHVPMNFVGYGSFAVACGAGMAYLVRERIEQSNPHAAILGSFPSLEQLDQLAYKAVAIGFPAFTLATILGAAWAAEAWGGYWSWDPKETWALIVWLVYGAYLHVRVSHGWQGHSLAWWTVIGFLTTVFCFVGVNMYLSGLHSYGRLA